MHKNKYSYTFRFQNHQDGVFRKVMTSKEKKYQKNLQEKMEKFLQAKTGKILQLKKFFIAKTRSSIKKDI